MDLMLADRVVLVTGGSKGIGAAIARAFVAEGAVVANVNRPGPEGEALQQELAAEGGTCRLFAADLCDVQQCARVVRDVLSAFGRIDVVVNNAGVNDGVGLEAGVEAFERSLRRNLVHYYAVVHHALPELKRHRGAIVNIGSKVSVTGQGGTSGYAAAKGAINALTREWAADLARFGVRVNAVIPAEVWTPLYEKWLATFPDPAKARGAIERLIPLGRRFTTPEEIADTVVFLASPRSSHTTGQLIFVDGGYTHLDRKLTAADPQG
ncbi:MAG: SDR family oxidoreductase [Planctomycetota bacterium]|nr:MAG: SDR family oxidoreductase [Planctomycetota bacterium]